jgi:hypothetical protein
MKAQLRISMFAILLMASSGIALAQDDPDDSRQRATGCLRKGATAKRYKLIDENGKLWDLRSKNVSFAPHVGHTVTVSGTIPQKSKNSDPSDTSPQNNLNVTALDMVSDTCQQ